MENINKKQPFLVIKHRQNKKIIQIPQIQIKIEQKKKEIEKSNQMIVQNLDLNIYKQIFAQYFEKTINGLKGNRKKKSYNSDEQLYHFSNIYHKIINLYHKQYDSHKGELLQENYFKRKKISDSIKKYKRKNLLAQTIDQYFKEDSQRLYQDDIEYEIIQKKIKSAATDKQIFKYLNTIYGPQQKQNKLFLYEIIKESQFDQRLSIQDQEMKEFEDDLNNNDNILKDFKEDFIKQINPSIQPNQFNLILNNPKLIFIDNNQNIINQINQYEQQNINQNYYNQSEVQQDKSQSYFNFFINKCQQSQNSNLPLAKSFEMFANQISKSEENKGETLLNSPQDNLKKNNIIITSTEQKDRNMDMKIDLKDLKE